jgi:hypothetical protein
LAAGSEAWSSQAREHLIATALEVQAVPIPEEPIDHEAAFKSLMSLDPPIAPEDVLAKVRKELLELGTLVPGAPLPSSTPDELNRRRNAIELLSKLTPAAQSMPILLQALHREPDEDVRMVVYNSIEDHIRDIKEPELARNAVDELLELLDLELKIPGPRSKHGCNCAAKTLSTLARRDWELRGEVAKPSLRSVHDVLVHYRDQLPQGADKDRLTYEAVDPL